MRKNTCIHSNNYGYCLIHRQDIEKSGYVVSGFTPVHISTPSTTQYLDFGGTAFDVQWVGGGPIK